MAGFDHRRSRSVQYHAYRPYTVASSQPDFLAKNDDGATKGSNLLLQGLGIRSESALIIVRQKNHRVNRPSKVLIPLAGVRVTQRSGTLLHACRECSAAWLHVVQTKRLISLRRQESCNEETAVLANSLEELGFHELVQRAGHPVAQASQKRFDFCTRPGRERQEQVHRIVSTVTLENVSLQIAEHRKC